MAFNVEEINPRIRKWPVIGRLYLVLAFALIAFAWLGVLIFGTICEAVGGALVAAKEHISDTILSGREAASWLVGAILANWRSEGGEE